MFHGYIMRYYNNIPNTSKCIRIEYTKNINK